jgi:hypothetical protein
MVKAVAHLHARTILPLKELVANCQSNSPTDMQISLNK